MEQKSMWNHVLPLYGDCNSAIMRLLSGEEKIRGLVWVLKQENEAAQPSLVVSCPPSPPSITASPPAKSFPPNPFGYDITARHKVKIILDIFIIHPPLFSLRSELPVLFADKNLLADAASADHTSKRSVFPWRVTECQNNIRLCALGGSLI